VPERTCLIPVDRDQVVPGAKTLRPGENQGRKGRTQAMSVLVTGMETLKHA